MLKNWKIKESEDTLSKINATPILKINETFMGKPLWYIGYYHHIHDKCVMKNESLYQTVPYAYHGMSVD